MFAIGFFSSSISWLHMTFFSGPISETTVLSNIYYWASVPLMVAISLAVLEKVMPAVNFVWHFRIFLACLIACYVLIFIPGNLRTYFQMISMLIAMFILVCSTYLFIRDRNSLDLLYFFGIIAYMVGGMAQAREMTELSVFSFVYGNLILGFLFLGDVRGSKGTYFSIKKQLEDAEKNLAVTENRYRKIVENASNVIVLASSNGTITYVSPSIKKILDLDPDKLIGMNVQNICPEGSGHLKNYYMNLSKTILDIEFEHECTLSQKKIRWLLHTIKKLECDGGFEVMHVLKDITEIREAKNILDNKVSDLERSERASLNIMEDLNETVNTLKIVERKLAEKNRELEEYTYTVSHDLKSPLVTIQGFSDLLAQNYGDKLDDKGRHYIDRINQGSDRLNRLVSDLLELSRAGRKTKAFEVHDFNSILATSLESLQGKISQAGVKVTHPNDFPRIYGDDMRLSQVLNNLIVNAVNYMGEQKNPEINISWEDRGKCHAFHIRDNGVGIKKEDMDRIFKIFERASETAKGTGIGLSIVRKIVETHGGELTVESEFGKGSTFTFTIPKQGAEI
jgi:PAS domain S-box-containing protein